MLQPGDDDTERLKKHMARLRVMPQGVVQLHRGANATGDTDYTGYTSTDTSSRVTGCAPPIQPWPAYSSATVTSVASPATVDWQQSSAGADSAVSGALQGSGTVLSEASLLEEQMRRNPVEPVHSAAAASASNTSTVERSAIDRNNAGRSAAACATVTERRDASRADAERGASGRVGSDGMREADARAGAARVRNACAPAHAVTPHTFLQGSPSAIFSACDSDPSPGWATLARAMMQLEDEDAAQGDHVPAGATRLQAVSPDLLCRCATPNCVVVESVFCWASMRLSCNCSNWGHAAARGMPKALCIGATTLHNKFKWFTSLLAASCRMRRSRACQ